MPATAALKPQPARAAKKPKVDASSAPAALLRPLPHEVPVFRTPEDISRAVEHVLQRDPVLAPLVQEHGHPVKLLAQQDMTTYQSLSKTIIYQQLHGKAAACIHERFLALCEGPLTPSVVQTMDRTALRGCGLSERKVDYLLALADMFANAHEHLDDQHIQRLPDESLKEILTQVKGVGPWTVDMLCMFKLGRQNVLPVGDLAVRKGMQVLYGLRDLPTPQQMESIADKWHPYRSVGTYMMWRVPTTKSSPKSKKPRKSTSKSTTPSEPAPDMLALDIAPVAAHTLPTDIDVAATYASPAGGQDTDTGPVLTVPTDTPMAVILARPVGLDRGTVSVDTGTAPGLATPVCTLMTEVATGSLAARQAEDSEGAAPAATTPVRRGRSRVRAQGEGDTPRAPAQRGRPRSQPV